MRMLANQERCLACKKIFYTTLELTYFNDAERPMTVEQCLAHKLPACLRDLYRRSEHGDQPVWFEWYENGRWLRGYLGHPGHCSSPCYGATQERKAEEKRRAKDRKDGWRRPEDQDGLLSLAMVDEMWDEQVVDTKTFRERRVIPPKVLR